MQDQPDRDALLGAVAELLKGQVIGAVADPGLRFRVLIASHVLGVVRRELRGEHEAWAAEVGRLETLLGADGPVPEPDLLRDDHRHAAVEAANGWLAERIDQGDPTLDLEAARAHVLASLREKLSVVNPRFDLSPEIE